MATPASTRDKRLRLAAEAMNCAIPDGTAVKAPRGGAQIPSGSTTLLRDAERCRRATALRERTAFLFAVSHGITRLLSAKVCWITRASRPVSPQAALLADPARRRTASVRGG